MSPEKVYHTVERRDAKPKTRGATGAAESIGALCFPAKLTTPTLFSQAEAAFSSRLKSFRGGIPLAGGASSALCRWLSARGRGGKRKKIKIYKKKKKWKEQLRARACSAQASMKPDGVSWRKPKIKCSKMTKLFVYLFI